MNRPSGGSLDGASLFLHYYKLFIEIYFFNDVFSCFV